MTNETMTPTPRSPLPHGRARRFGLRFVLLAMAVSSAVVGVAVWWIGNVSRKSGPREISQQAKARYQCPMHPTIIQGHPGNCPICGMKLVEIEGEQAVGATPGVGDSSSRVLGQIAVTIAPERQQLIGLATAKVREGAVGGAWRTTARVAIDETRVRHVNVKVTGFVERIYVDFIGKAVRKGAPLFTMYSPELLAAQEEYLLALRTRGALSKGDTFTDDGDTLVKASRKKLALWDIPQAEIDRIAATRATTKTLTFYSPASGVVTKKAVVEGMKLEAGAMPYEIVDLSSVWVLADVYENELRFITEGMPATLSLKAFPNREFKGKVLFMDPLLDPRTRTIKVRLAFANPGGDLRPEMFGEVVLHGKPRKGLLIPQDAVIDSGTDKFVFVALGNGKFRPQIVQLGESGGKDVEVVSGLEVGVEVVTRANFLIDSESKLRASLAGMPRRNAAKVLDSTGALPGPDTQKDAPVQPQPSVSGTSHQPAPTRDRHQR